MSYDQSKLVTDVRMFLGGVSEEKLPEPTIVYYGDFYDNDTRYTDNYPYIFWKTTLACLDFLKASSATSSESQAAKSSRKEKIGDVEVTVTEDSSSTSSSAVSYDDLYEDYSKNPWKFGIIEESGTGVVLINGVDAEEVERYRTNKNTTSIYNPLPVTAFPKTTGIGDRTRGRRLY